MSYDTDAYEQTDPKSPGYGDWIVDLADGMAVE